MVYALPVPNPPQDDPTTSGLKWELAAPTYDGPEVSQGGEEGRVTRYRTGPGDAPNAAGVDQWADPLIYDIPHTGVESGRQLFELIPGPAPEGHQGYDFPDQDLIINRSTSRQALFWSDWTRSVAKNFGGAGSFTGEHVVIARIPPGSVQGYQPTDPGMVQLNNDRNLPSPWDQNLTIGGTTGA